MYELTLTADERKAQIWIGNRYFHGDQLATLLSDCMPYDDELDADSDYTFRIPEHVAWEIREGFEAEKFSFACISTNFAAKLCAFADRIV